MNVEIKPQSEFPLLEEYRKYFPITPDTIFALKDTIYCNNPLTRDLYVHEVQHLKQQEKVGLKEWVYDFLHEPLKRLEYELEAYRVQLLSIKDREQRNRIRIVSAQTLSSALYGNLIDQREAFLALKV